MVSHKRKSRGLKEANAKSFYLKISMQKEFAAAVHPSEDPLPSQIFVLGWTSNYVDSENVT
jgi:hypothetical protein